MSNSKFEEILDKYGELTYTNKGTSMLPMLRPEKDVFTIKKTEDGYKENDVVLFKRNGRYLLHRIVKVFDDHYTIMGDNCVSCEENVRDEDMLGVLVSFQRDGKKIDVNDPLYRLYVRQLRFLERPRVLMKRTLLSVKKLIKKMFGL